MKIRWAWDDNGSEMPNKSMVYYGWNMSIITLLTMAWCLHLLRDGTRRRLTSIFCLGRWQWHLLIRKHEKRIIGWWFIDSWIALVAPILLKSCFCLLLLVKRCFSTNLLVYIYAHISLNFRESRLMMQASNLRCESNRTDSLGLSPNTCDVRLIVCDTNKTIVNTLPFKGISRCGAHSLWFEIGSSWLLSFFIPFSISSEQNVRNDHAPSIISDKLVKSIAQPSLGGFSWFQVFFTSFVILWLLNEFLTKLD